MSRVLSITQKCMLKYTLLNKNLRMSKKSSNFDLLPPYMGTPSKVQSRPAGHIPPRAFFAKPNGFPCCIGL